MSGLFDLRQPTAEPGEHSMSNALNSAGKRSVLRSASHPFFSHERAPNTSDDWLTPPELVEALGHFDLDPCASKARTRRLAPREFTIDEDGLAMPWQGRVWLNPPYSSVACWMKRLAEHGDGIALVFARVDTRWFHDLVWKRADAVFFLRGRVSFLRCNGGVVERSSSSGAPSVFIAYGERNVDALRSLKGRIDGRLVTLNRAAA